jgi:hypothetical protein
LRLESRRGMDRYRIEEVARQDGRAGSRSWIVIRGRVYDVTDFKAQVRDRWRGTVRGGALEAFAKRGTGGIGAATRLLNS